MYREGQTKDGIKKDAKDMKREWVVERNKVRKKREEEDKANRNAKKWDYSNYESDDEGNDNSINNNDSDEEDGNIMIMKIFMRVIQTASIAI